MGVRREREIKREFLKGFGRLRSKFRRFQSELLIEEIVQYLNSGDLSRKAEQAAKQPWAQVVLIKWLLIDPDFGRGKAVPSYADTYPIMDKIAQLQSKTRLPSDYPDLLLFMRVLATQQFYYQRSFSKISFARQKVIFETLPENHSFQTQFKQTTGFSISTYLDLSLSLVSFLLITPRYRFSSNIFQEMHSGYSAEVQTQFFESMSKTWADLRRWLRGKSPQQREAVEYYMETPLFEVPLLKTGEQFLCWHPAILHRHVENCIYDKLRQIDPAAFMDKFGDLFEKYIDDVFQKSGAKFFNEDQIKPLLNGEKCVDFLVAEDDALLLIDAKGVELSAEAKTTHRPEVIKSKTKNSIVKAIEQSYSVFEHVEKLKPLLELKREKVTPYVLVITYKEHYLGDGKVFALTIAPDRIAKIKQTYPNVSIPEAHMYFITIDEFDCLAEAVRQGKTTFLSFMKQVVDADSKPETKKFSFSMHLSESKFHLYPEHLNKATDQIFERIEKAFGNKDENRS